MPNNLSESQVIRIWQHQLLDRTVLITEGGEPIEVIYPGRKNDDRGADFRDAVIATSRGLIRGDIEVHVKSSGWRDHRHHQDAVYNRVILHVVMWHSTNTATNLENGREVPILALDKYVKVPISQWPDLVCSPPTLNIPCFKVGQRLTTGAMAGFVDRAGEERFLAKAARFRTDLSRMEASQSLYQGIMGALGYSRNKLPLLELAHRLPLQILESMTKGEIADEECLARQQTLLLGAAGLLPSQCQERYQGNRLEDKWIDKLERLWASSEHTEVMSPNAWHLFKVRPNNSPIRRLVAMSYLILRYKQEGIFKTVVNMIKAIPSDKGHRRLEEGLLVTANGYWASHFDFGPGSRTRSPTLLGSGRATDITVNVLLPFTVAWGQFTSQSGLERKALDLYHRHPKLAVNSVERHMRDQLGLNSSLVNSAQRQQGLIHIYNSLCTQGRCSHCRLNQLKAGKYIQI
ncbi:DUF2851 family protein [Chloroflexota bacterium]